jgi:hypothetical protein
MARSYQPHRTASLLPAFFLLACGGGGDAPAAAQSANAAQTAIAAQEASSSGILFDRELRRAGCELLTPAMVAAVTGAPVNGMRQTTFMGSCSYEWDDGRAELGSVVVSAGVEAAARGFEQAYRTLSPEEAEAGARAVREQVERQVAEGKMTREQAEMSAGLLDVAAARSASAKFEPVSGIGDRAVYEGVINVNEMGGGFGTIVTLGSNASVLLGNMVFTVGVDVWKPEGGVGREPPPQEVMARNRELTLALAQRMVTELMARR